MRSTKTGRKSNRKRDAKIRDRSRSRDGGRDRSGSHVVDPPTDERRPRSVVGGVNEPPPSASASRTSTPRGVEATMAPFDQAAFIASLKQTIADEVKLATERSMAEMRDEWNVPSAEVSQMKAEEQKQLKLLKSSQKELQRKTKALKLKSESNRQQYDFCSEMKSHAEEIHNILSDPDNLDYENLAESRRRIEEIREAAGWGMNLIEKIDEYGAGGWSIATKVLAAKERTEDPDLRKEWEVSMKSFESEKKEKEKEREKEREKAARFKWGGRYDGRGPHFAPVRKEQCRACYGLGHWEKDCPVSRGNDRRRAKYGSGSSYTRYPGSQASGEEERRS